MEAPTRWPLTPNITSRGDIVGCSMHATGRFNYLWWYLYKRLFYFVKINLTPTVNPNVILLHKYDAIDLRGNVPRDEKGAINMAFRKCKVVCVSRRRRWDTLSSCCLYDPQRRWRDPLYDPSHPAVHDTTCPHSVEPRYGAKRNGKIRLPDRSASLQPRRRRGLLLQTENVQLYCASFNLYKYVLL